MHGDERKSALLVKTECVKVVVGCDNPHTAASLWFCLAFYFLDESGAAMPCFSKRLSRLTISHAFPLMTYVTSPTGACSFLATNPLASSNWWSFPRETMVGEPQRFVRIWAAHSLSLSTLIWFYHFLMCYTLTMADMTQTCVTCGKKFLVIEVEQEFLKISFYK